MIFSLKFQDNNIESRDFVIPILLYYIWTLPLANFTFGNYLYGNVFILYFRYFESISTSVMCAKPTKQQKNYPEIIVMVRLDITTRSSIWNQVIKAYGLLASVQHILFVNNSNFVRILQELK